MTVEQFIEELKKLPPQSDIRFKAITKLPYGGHNKTEVKLDRIIFSTTPVVEFTE